MHVFLIAPNFRTRGGFEAQLTALAVGLVELGLGVDVFVREAVASDHLYWQKMRAAGVHLHAPSAWLARWLQPTLAVRQVLLKLGLALLSPLLLPVVLADMAAHRRNWMRSWQGGVGRVRGWLGPLVFFDALTWRFEWDLNSGWRQTRPDLIDVQHSMIPSGIVWGRRHGLPVIYTEYGAPVEEFWPVWAGLQPIINQSDFIIGRAQASLDGLKRLCQADRPWAIVPNAVTTGPAAAAKLALPEGEEVVISAIGRLVAEKGLLYLLEAFRQLRGEGLCARLIFAGDGPLRTQLETQTRESGLTGCVTFTGAFDDLAPIIQMTHIAAHPTLNDGRSVAVLEAMAWGRPVVASAVGGLPELVEPEVTGLLVPPGNVDELAAALRRLAVEPATRARMGQAARVKYETGQYSVEGMVSATIQVYQRVLEATGHSDRQS